MSGSFHLYLLGRPRLVAPSGDEIRIGVRKHMGLLAWLAMAGPGPARREFLAELLWPGVEVPRARQSLAQALSVLRARMAPGSFSCDRDTVAMVPGFLELDVRRLETGDVLGDEYIAPLEVDGFLTGFEIPDAPDFDHWAEAQRARLLPSITMGLLALMNRARRTGDTLGLERSAERLLAMDDLSEHGVHGRMEAWAMAGDRVAALRLFDEWSERLASELGAGPPAHLEALATRLRRRGWERPLAGGKALPAVQTEQWQDRPFVGRAAEYQALYDHWQEVRAGRAACVLVTGESGVGKTMLVDRFGTAAALEGATLARARCFEVERQVPFAAIGGLLGRLCDRPGAAATSPVSLAVLAPVVPEVRRRWSALPPVPDLRGEAARVRLADAAAELLGALADEHPVILVLDDAHIADEASLAVLHLVIRQLPDRAVMVVMISRQGPAGGDGARTLRDVAAGAGFDLLALEPMPPEEAEELLDRLLESVDRRPGLTERRVLLHAAAGYPLPLDLLVRDWVERGPACLALSLGAMTPDVPGAAGEGWRWLAVSLYDRLEPSTRVVLHLAALLDRRLNELSMYSLVDISMAQAMYGLATLTFNGTLRDTGTGLEFMSPTLRAHAYLGIPSSLRRILHHAVAGVLLEREAGGEWIPGLELAWHCIRGGREGEMPQHLLRGAREAINSGAPHEAEIALRSGRELLGGLDADRCYLLLSESTAESGRAAETLAALEDRGGWAATDSSAEASVVASHARYCLAPVDPTPTLIQLGQSWRSESGHSPHVRVGALYSAAAIVESGPEASAQRASMLAALADLPVDELSPEDRVRWLLAQAKLHYFGRATQKSLLLVGEARDLVVRHGMRSTLGVSVRSGLGALSVAEGRYSEGLSDYLEAYEASKVIHNATLIARSAANVALCLGRLGSFTKQVEWAKLALEHCQQEGRDSDYRLFALCHWLSGASQLLQAEEVGSACAIIERDYGTHAQPWMVQRAKFAQADALLTLGHRGAAMAMARRAMGGELALPLSRGLVGIHSRWAAQLHNESVEAGHTVNYVSGLLEDLGSLDALDRLEVVLSAVRLGIPEAEELEAAVVAALPAATVRHVRQLALA